jgi:hypothetical protein
MQIGKDPLITSGGVQFTGGTGHGKERSLDLFAGSRSITIAGSACGHDYDLGCNYLSAALREMRSRWSLGHENGEIRRAKSVIVMVTGWDTHVP